MNKFKLTLEVDGKSFGTITKLSHEAEGVELSNKIILKELDLAVRRVFYAYSVSKGMKHGIP